VRAKLVDVEQLQGRVHEGPTRDAGADINREKRTPLDKRVVLSCGSRGRCRDGGRGGAFLQAHPLREVTEDHDVADALDPTVWNRHRAAALHEQGVRLTDEYPVDLALLHVHDQVVHVPQEDAVVCVDLEADDLRNLLERSLTIPWPAVFDIGDMKASVANVPNFSTILH
jgi:hypothetical protein